MNRSRFGLLDTVESIPLETKKRLKKKYESSNGGNDTQLEKRVEALEDTVIGDYSGDIKDYKYNPNNDPFILDPGEDKFAYGVLVDFRNTDNADDAVTRIGNMEYHKTLPCHQYKGQIYDLVNKEVVCKLNPANWNLAYDGKTAQQIADAMKVATNTIEVIIDSFYITSKVLHTNENGNPDLFKVMFSPVKINDRYRKVKKQAIDFRKGRLFIDNQGSWIAANLYDDTDICFGGFNGWDDDNDEFVDKNNRGNVPTTGLNRYQFRINAGYSRHLLNYYSYQYIIYWAFVIEYKTLNSQKAVNNQLDENGYHQGGLGIGMTSTDEAITNWTNSDYYFTNSAKSHPTVRNIGVTNSLGNGSGEIVVQENGHSYHQNRYRGFEFPFGDIYVIPDGVAGFIKQDIVSTYYDENEEEKNNYERSIHYYLSDDPNNYADSPSDVADKMELVAKVPDYLKGNEYDGGWFKRAVIGDIALLIPCETYNEDDNSEINFCDSQYGAGDFTENDEYVAVPFMGGGAAAGSYAGLADFAAADDAAGAYYYAGCSLMRFIDD